MPLRLRYDIDSLDNVDPQVIKQAYRLLHRPLERYFRAEVRGLDRIPAGAGLYVGNHSGGIITPDSFLFGCALYRERGLEYLPYGLGHEVAIRAPVAHQIILPLGAVRASHENARRLFQADKKVIVYPGGDLDDMRPFCHRERVVFGGRRGYIRLALRSGVPVIPVVSAGGHETFLVLDDGRWLARWMRADKLLRSKVWPIILSMPWGITVGPLPFYLPFPSWVLMEVLPPITFERHGEAAANDAAYVKQCATRVESAMQGALERLYAERRRRGGLLAGLLSGRPRPDPLRDT
jgi:1-acyl-sn-glycerol-3-phosphate acyltransferase